MCICPILPFDFPYSYAIFLAMITSETLNWADMDSLMGNLSALNPIQSGLLMHARNQLSGDFRWTGLTYGSYEKNASLIALSSWTKASRYIKCGMPSSHGRAVCNEREYCDFCAWKKGKAIYDALKPAYGRAEYWYHITYAYDKNVDLNTVSKADYLAKYNEGFAYIKKLISEEVILGAYAVAEYSVNSVSHALVYPHIHAVVCSDRPLLEYEGEDMVEIVHSSLIEHKGQNVSLNVTTIENSKQFESVVRYSAKAVDLKKVYEMEIGLQPLEVLNNGINVILNKTSELEFKFKKFQYFGNLDSRKKSYIGYKDPKKVDGRTKAAKKKKLKEASVSSTMGAMDSKSTYQFKLHMAKAAAAPVVTVNGNAVQPQQKPSLLRRMAPYALAGTAALGGAYLADKHFLDGKYFNRGVNWLAGKMTPEGFKAQQRNAILGTEAKSGLNAANNVFRMDRPRDVTVGEAVGNTVAPIAGAGAGAAGLSGLGVKGLSAAAEKFPNALRGISGVAKLNPAVNRAMPAIGGVADAAINYSLAQNPLVNEGWSDPANVWWNPASWFNKGPRDPETVRKALSAAGLATGASGAIKSPISLATLPASIITNSLVGAAEEKLRQQSADAAASQRAKEILFQLYRGAKSGDVHRTQLLHRWLEAHGDMSQTSDPILKNLLNRANNL